MRPLFHPSLDAVRLETLLHALSDPVRVGMLTQIIDSSCAQSCTAFAQIGDRVIPKSSLSQHFRILREAGLVRSERVGVEVRNTVRCEEVNARFPGLLAAILEAHRREMARQDASAH
jgi:DNA-binding transcriptional ArsR family regulator